MNYPSNMIPCTREHLRYLAERMRPDEIEQWLAYNGHEAYDPSLLVDQFMKLNGPKFTVMGTDGFPAAAGGYACLEAGCWRSWMVGSMEGWEHNWRALTKATRWLIEALFKAGAKQIETYVIPSRTKAIDWYERGLGMIYWKTLPAAAANDEDVLVYVRTA